MPRKPWVTKPDGKRFYVVRWVDPITGTTRQRATEHTRRRDAERVADAMQLELDAGLSVDDTDWLDFRRRYLAEGLAHCRPGTVAKWKTAARLVDRRLRPSSVKDLNQNALSKLRGALAAEGMKASTLDSHFRHILAALSWAYSMRMIPGVPHLPAKRGKKRRKMKGRPISTEEYERMLDQCPNDSWRHFLRGLWLSGMRLNEALNLSWDDPSLILVVGVDNRRPMLEIPKELQKSDEDLLYPITPDFAWFLRETPPDERIQYVFDPMLSRGVTRSLQTASAKICDIGKAAGVVSVPAVGKKKPKFASAHDLRRSFGTRWSLKVMPTVLQQLMRHSDIATTMQFYVGRNAEELADTIWAADVASERDPLRDPERGKRSPKVKKP